MDRFLSSSSSKVFIWILVLHIHNLKDYHSHVIHTSDIHSAHTYSYSLGSITQTAVSIPSIVIMSITTFSADDSIRVRREYICRRSWRRSRRAGRSRCWQRGLGARSRRGCCAYRLDRRMRRRGRFSIRLSLIALIMNIGLSAHLRELDSQDHQHQLREKLARHILNIAIKYNQN